MREGVGVKQMVVNKNNELIRYIWPDPVNLNAFYYVFGKDYGKKLQVKHTHNPALHLKFICQLEPDMFRIYDMKLF